MRNDTAAFDNSGETLTGIFKASDNRRATSVSGAFAARAPVIRSPSIVSSNGGAGSFACAGCIPSADTIAIEVSNIASGIWR